MSQVLEFWKNISVHLCINQTEIHHGGELNIAFFDLGMFPVLFVPTVMCG